MKTEKNFEKKVRNILEAQGHTVYSSGYPDFMVHRSGKYSGVAAVEVKQGSDKVRPNQEEMHKIFKQAGIPVYVIRPESLEENRKLRFKKIINITHYKDMMERISIIHSALEPRETYLLGIIEKCVREMSALRDEVRSIKKDLEIDGIILK
tara:strand:+ start:27 stop:479 length:453 start_codon:yes stop_codon:yes gene_type:complete